MNPDPSKPYPGEWLTRGECSDDGVYFLIVRPMAGKRNVLDVRVYSFAGSLMQSIRATQMERTKIQVPNPKTMDLDQFPGSVWFYNQDGEELGFLLNDCAGALDLPMAVETEREGPTKLEVSDEDEDAQA